MNNQKGRWEALPLFYFNAYGIIYRYRYDGFVTDHICDVGYVFHYRKYSLFSPWYTLGV